MPRELDLFRKLLSGLPSLQQRNCVKTRSLTGILAVSGLIEGVLVGKKEAGKGVYLGGEK